MATKAWSRPDASPTGAQSSSSTPAARPILQELGPDDKPLRKAVFPAFKVGGMMRPTGEGTFLLGAKLNEFAEVDLDGTIHRRVTIPKPKPCYHTLPVSDGNILTSCGYGAFIAEIDPKGKIVNRIGGMQDAPEGVNPFFFGGMQLLENGHIVVANWNGHANHSWRNGAQLIEYDEAGRIVWTYHDAKRIPGTLHGVLILE